jgi:hypothetical protein
MPSRKLRRLSNLLIVMAVIGPMTGPSEAADLYTPGVHKRLPKHSLNYPYGGSYLIGTYYARHSLGSPYVGVYFGNYYPPYYDYYPRYSSASPCLKRTWACY